MNRRMLMAALAAIGMSVPASAQNGGPEPPPGESQPAAIPNPEQPEINALRAEGWSWKDIGYGRAIAQKSGKALEEIATEKNSGLAWKKVAELNGLKLKDIEAEAARLAKESEQEQAQPRP